MNIVCSCPCLERSSMPLIYARVMRSYMQNVLIKKVAEWVGVAASLVRNSFAKVPPQNRNNMTAHGAA